MMRRCICTKLLHTCREGVYGNSSTRDLYEIDLSQCLLIGDVARKFGGGWGV